jgi:uncharacterized membrane protein
MLWNLYLAAIPSVLAVVCFRRRSSVGPAWWALFACWWLCLPNAPYVLTDVLHMVDDVRAAPTRPDAYTVLAIYGAFFAAGLCSYVFSLQRFRRFLHEHVSPRLVVPVLVAVHGSVVVAMFIGRVMRLNSWDIVFAPRTVLRAVVRVPQPTTVVLLGTMFVVVGFAAFATAAVADKALAQLRRTR